MPGTRKGVVVIQAMFTMALLVSQAVQPPLHRKAPPAAPPDIKRVPCPVQSRRIAVPERLMADGIPAAADAVPVTHGTALPVSRTAVHRILQKAHPVPAPDIRPDR